MGKHKQQKLWIGLIILLLAAGGAVAFVLVTKSKSQVPSTIARQLEFKALVPAANSDSQDHIAVQTNTYLYNASDKVLTFKVSEDGVSVTIAEQSYPEVLVYDKLVGAMKQYDEIQTQQGKVALTRPDSANGGQVAVLSTYNGSNGILLFAKPDSDLSNTQWEQLFNAMRQQND